MKQCKTDLVAQYCINFPDTPSLTLAKKIFSEHPDFCSAEHARDLVRRVRGRHGERQLFPKYAAIAMNYKSGGLTDSGISIPEAYDTKPERYIKGNWLVLSDTQMPWHCTEAIEAGIKEGRRQCITHVLLNGDISDSYQFSKFWKRPDKAIFIKERFALEEFFQTLRENFPKADIVWKYGNHDLSLERYMSERAPAIYDEKEHNWFEILNLAEYGVEVIQDYRRVYLGKLLVVHGHEFGNVQMPPVSPARWLLNKAKVPAILCSHFHKTSSDNYTTANEDLQTAWSIGCLCGLHPRWRSINDWNQGFAIVQIKDSKGNFDVQNFRRLPNGTLVK